MKTPVTYLAYRRMTKPTLEEEAEVAMAGEEEEVMDKTEAEAEEGAMITDEAVEIHMLGIIALMTGASSIRCSMTGS